MNLYKTIPVGKINKCALGWLSVIMSAIEPDGYNKNGYFLEDKKIKKALKNDKIKEYAQNYWNGKKISKLDIKKLNISEDVETFIFEYLCKKIKIVSEI